LIFFFWGISDDKEKNAHLEALKALGPLEVFRADLDNEGSFDDAVAGCDYAFLVAAPVALMPENPEVTTNCGFDITV
jgi:anthocyanidin reductase